ncbi:hypothetical protein [Aeromicrobium endophyticum]|uniref:Uncharacterized protein n=1 Tax=Aeromicrobium endophyticum TaxID=2292704 RepID=A0A371P3U9_9ACTN|nr:hypothetical protein [Aeromicrobium endophyticum]REK70066.1 hypothetical protein DX116_12875 [Aeromicrobium endophyticum]
MSRDDRPDAWRPADRPLRALRSTAAALVCVVAAAIGHHSAGGALPAGAVVSVFAGSALVAWLLSARRVTATQLLGLLVLCQVAVHLGASSGEMTMGAAMMGAHLAATAVSVLALARGEAFVWSLAERLALRVAPLLHAVHELPVVVAGPVSTAAPRSRRDVHLAHSRWLRGPPVSPA